LRRELREQFAYENLCLDLLRRADAGVNGAEHIQRIVAGERRTRDPHGAAAQLGGGDIADCYPRVPVQLFDWPGSALVVSDLAPGFLEDFHENGLVPQSWEVALEPGHERSKSAVDMRPERLPGVVEQPDCRAVFHTWPRCSRDTSASNGTDGERQYTPARLRRSPRIRGL